MNAKKNKSNRGWWAALMGFLAYWLWRRWRRGGGEERPAGVSEESLRRGYEGETISIRGVVIFAVLLVVSAVVIHAAIYWMMTALEVRHEAEEPISPYADYQQVPPPPRLQADPALDLQLLHQIENQVLYTYGWVNRAEGVVRIPIGRAMAVLANRELPVREEAAAFLGEEVVTMTESGFVLESLEPPFPPYMPPPYLGSSPEPYTVAGDYRQYLIEEGYLMRPEESIAVE